ncbi:hypothetical protein [Marinobacter sp. KMM 10035]|uniref:hypothetical protein n=1 Tax=Marinobacter sp. KMM 10035 TaxID=3134034 RepID=UPI00397C6A7E
MKLKCYLVVQGKVPRYGLDKENTRVAGAIRLTKTRPSTDKDEIAVALDLDIPDSLFIKPVLQANISVPEGAPHGGAITAEVADNIAEVIRQQTGFSVRVSAEQEGE